MKLDEPRKNTHQKCISKVLEMQVEEHYLQIYRIILKSRHFLKRHILDVTETRASSFLDTWILERLSSLGNEGTSVQGLKSVTYI